MILGQVVLSLKRRVLLPPQGNAPSKQNPQNPTKILEGLGNGDRLGHSAVPGSEPRPPALARSVLQKTG